MPPKGENLKIFFKVAQLTLVSFGIFYVIHLFANGGPSQVAPSIDPTQDEELIVQVYAADSGGIADITAAPRTGSFSLGQDTSALFKYLQDKAKAARLEKKPPPKLRLEISWRMRSSDSASGTELGGAGRNPGS